VFVDGEYVEGGDGGEYVEGGDKGDEEEGRDCIFL